MTYHISNAQGIDRTPRESDGPDFEVSTDGSLWLVRPTNDAATRHLEENVQADAQWWCGALVVEHRYVGQLVEALTEAGYRVRVN